MNTVSITHAIEFVFSHVICFPHSNISSPSKNLYIIIENVYYKDGEPKVTINIIIKRKEKLYI
jgi:hypothetical protein